MAAGRTCDKCEDGAYSAAYICNEASQLKLGAKAHNEKVRFKVVGFRRCQRQHEQAGLQSSALREQLACWNYERSTRCRLQAHRRGPRVYLPHNPCPVLLLTLLYVGKIVDAFIPHRGSRFG